MDTNSLKFSPFPPSNNNLFETPCKNKDPSLSLDLPTCPTTTSKNGYIVENSPILNIFSKDWDNKKPDKPELPLSVEEKPHSLKHEETDTLNNILKELDQINKYVSNILIKDVNG